ncbi:MAG: hypothetical protein ACTSPY_05570 [Candidatus Helarchaeota archaeon]
MNTPPDRSISVFMLLIVSTSGIFLIPLYFIPFINSYYLLFSSNTVVSKQDLEPMIDKCVDAILQELLPEGYFYTGDQVYSTSHILRPLNLVRILYNHSIYPELILMKNSIENNRQSNLFWRCNEFIATDIDSTLQALSALNGLSNKSFIYESLDKLSTLQLENGAFKTWIDAENYTFEELHTDPDCIENDENGVVLYYTYMINKSHYKDMLDLGAEFIANQQHANGTWTTPWYPGDYFGIYRIGSFLALYNKTKYYETLEKSYSFIMNTINSDNGWGKNGISNPLDTAYCITFLIYYTHNIYLVQKGLKYLIKTQLDNGLWPETPFFQIYNGPEYLYFGPSALVSGIVLETFATYIQTFYF